MRKRLGNKQKEGFALFKNNDMTSMLMGDVTNKNNK